MLRGRDCASAKPGPAAERDPPFTCLPSTSSRRSGITLLADLPGVSRDRLGVRVDGDTLLVRGDGADWPCPRGMELVYGEFPVPVVSQAVHAQP